MMKHRKPTHIWIGPVCIKPEEMPLKDLGKCMRWFVKAYLWKAQQEKKS